LWAVQNTIDCSGHNVENSFFSNQTKKAGKSDSAVQ